MTARPLSPKLQMIGFGVISLVTVLMIILSSSGQVLAQTNPAAPAQVDSSPPELLIAPIEGPANNSVTDVMPIESRIGNPSAPNQITLTAIPPRLGDEGNLTAKPGEKIQAVIRVRNSSDDTMAIHSVAQDFIVSQDGETPVPVTAAVSNRWSLASWITVSPENQTLGPRETAQVNLVIDVPADALPGGHYAMVLHEPVTGELDQNGLPIMPDTASAVSQRVGTLVYFVVEGSINEEAFLRGITFPSLTEYGPVPFSFEVENVSDIHIQPQITVDIYNFFGQKVDSLTIQTKNVFPFVPRTFEGQWDRVWGIGPYTAKFTMSFGSQGKVALARADFWLIPYKLVLAGVVVILVLLSLLILIKRHLQHRKQQEDARVKMLEDRLEELEADKTKQLEE